MDNTFQNVTVPSPEFIPQQAISVSVALSITALKIINEYLTFPMITPAMGEIYGKPILLYPETYKETWACDVSEKKIINASGGRMTIHDNISPKPKTFSLTGYIKCEPYEFLSTMVPSLKRKKKQLEIACLSRRPSIFRDIDGRIRQQVAIETIEFDYTAENMNALHFIMQLKEINTLEAVDGADVVPVKANSTVGGSNGDSLNKGIEQGKSKNISDLSKITGMGVKG